MTREFMKRSPVPYLTQRKIVSDELLLLLGNEGNPRAPADEEIGGAFAGQGDVDWGCSCAALAAIRTLDFSRLRAFQLIDVRSPRGWGVRRLTVAALRGRDGESRKGREEDDRETHVDVWGTVGGCGGGL